MAIPVAMKWTITSNTNTSGVVWPGGRGVFTAFGTFGSGTYKLQVSYDSTDGSNGTWIDVDRSGDTYCTFTSNGSGGFELPKCLVRVNVSGATSPSVTAGVQSAKQSA